MQTVALDVFAHVPPLLCGVLALCAYREKRRFLETGQNTAFGAFPVYVGATLISGFVATALDLGPKILRPGNFFENFGRDRAEEPAQSIAPQHVSARR